MIVVKHSPPLIEPGDRALVRTISRSTPNA
jgi:hypothetical protein